MATVYTQDANSTGLRYAEEVSPGVLSGSDIWYKLEPNEYDDFGGEYALVSRRPINDGRQRQKGVIVDLDASGGFTADFTQSGLESILQGFMFADIRYKGVQVVTAVDQDSGNPDEYEVASTSGFQVGNLIWATGFDTADNNGLNVVTAVVTDTSVEVATGNLTTEASPPSDAQIEVVGYQGDAGVLDISNTGAPALPRLTSTAGPDFTTLGLVPGEWIYLDGTAGFRFGTAANQGVWCRIYSIAAGYLEFDKTSKTLVTEASTTETVRIYYGHVLKNESDPTLIVKRSYQLERTLGAPDDSSPSQIQAEYLVGAVANELTLHAETAEIMTAEMSFVAMSHETVTGVEGVKAGTRPDLAASDAYNSTNDFSRLKMSILDRTGGANPSALFGYLTEFEININNNVSPNKAVANLGAISMTAGMFDVTGSATAYFSDVTAVDAIRDNEDVTMDFILVKNNKGVVIDIPLIALGDGRNNVEQDEAIMLDLDMPAAADAVFDHTLLFSFFHYLPDAAAA